MRYVLALCLSTILIVCGIAGFRFYRSQDFGRPDAGIRGALAHSPTGVLLIGSSHTYLSYDVEAIERATHGPAYLIGYNGLELASMAPVLKYMLADPATRPKVIIVEAYSSNLAHPPTMSDSRLYFESPPALKKQIVSDYLREHPGLNGYSDMFDLVVNRGNEVILTYAISSKLGGRNTYHGAGRKALAAGVSVERFVNFRAHVKRGIPDPGQLSALQQIIDAGRNSGVSLLFVESPMPGPVSRSPALQDLKRVFRDKLAQEDLPYLDGDTVFPIDDPQYFEDDNHLSGAGRAKFTSLVTKFLLAHRHESFPQTGTTQTALNR